MKATLALIFFQWFHLSLTCHEKLMFSEILLTRTISVLFSCKHTFILYIEKENQGKNTILCCWYIIMSLMSIIGKPFTRPHLSSLSWTWTLGMMWMCRESSGLASDNYHKMQRKNNHIWQFTDVWYSFNIGLKSV